MTSLSTLFSSGDAGAGAGQDPLEEGLPTIAVYGGDFNQNFDVRLHRVHSGELMGSPWSAITNSTASYSHGQSNMQMFGYSSDMGNLSSQYSTQGYTSYAPFTQSIYQNDHYPYSMYGSCSKEGRMGMQSFHGNSWYTKLYHRIHVQSLKGRRPRRQFNIFNYIFSETPLGNQYGWKSAIDVSTYINTSGHVTNNNGSCVYKQDTKQLVLYYPVSTGSTSGYFHIIQGTVDLMGVGNVKEFFDTATFKRFYGSGDVTNWGHSTYQYSVSLVLGDNNHIGVSIRNGNSHFYRVFDCSGASESTVAHYVNTSIGNTTSYGPEQGLPYRIRYQQTWDAKWGCMYGPYYYYGSGLSAFFMSIENPGKYYRVNLTPSSGGGTLTPSDTNGFMYLNGQNTDSSPIISWSVNFSNITSPGATAGSEYIGTSNVVTTSLLPTAYANGAALNASYTANQVFQYPGYYYSTSYPRFMTVNWWDQEGGYK